MKNEILQLIVLTGMTCFLLQSCGKEPGNGNDPNDEPVIELEKTYIEVGGKGGEYAVSYSVVNPKSEGILDVGTESSWITSVEVDVADIRFSISENPGKEPRSGSIILSYPGAASKSINVSQKVIDAEPDPDLSRDGSANCYIVPCSGTYRFSAVKGNSKESVGEVSSAEVLWESFGTDVSPKEGELVKRAYVSDGNIEFTVPEPFREGNALIAAKDASGKILWSWHIWLTDRPEDQVYLNGAGTMMDRNLGATSATPGDVGAFGLLYQWGRKDPFLGASMLSEDIKAESTADWPQREYSDMSIGTIEYTVEHPMTFIVSNSDNMDWYYTDDYTTDDTRWQSEKTIYDPCPNGYRVPDGGIDGIWNKAFGNTGHFVCKNIDKINRGYDFGALSASEYRLTSDPVCWYPSTGIINIDLIDVGEETHCWSCTVVSYRAYSIYFGDIGNVNPHHDGAREIGCSVRCMKED